MTADRGLPTVAEIIGLLEQWYPPATAEDWDAVGLVAGEPARPVRRILLAVDPVAEVMAEAAAWDADLLVVHHPLFLQPVHGFSTITPKGRALHQLYDAGCALYTAHTNADLAAGGVSESLATALGLANLEPIHPAADDPSTGTGRIGTLPPTTLRAFAETVATALPATEAGVRVAGDPDRPVSRIAVTGGAGDFLLGDLVSGDLAGGGIDVYVTSDLRHHPASEFLAHDGPALIDIPHWAAEWTWLPSLDRRLTSALATRSSEDTVEIRVSEICTDPWQFRI